jgi:phage tail sheath gpL-like
MPISFNLIPNLLLTPGAYIEYDSSRGVQGLALLPKRAVIIGSRLSTGTVAAGVLTQILSPDDGDRYFGRGSQLAAACRAYKKANRLTEVWAVSLTDAGTAATKTITITGPATSDGTLHFLVGGRPVDVAVTNAQTATQIATAVDTAFALYEADWLYTFAPAAGVVTGTARNANAASQNFDIRLNYYEGDARDMPSGVAVVVADGVAGATNPTVATAITAIGDEWFTTWVSLYSDTANVAIIEAELEDRWGPEDQQDGKCFYSIPGTHGDITTIVSARNSPFSCMLAQGTSPTPPCEVAAILGAVWDTESDPARPRQTLKLPGMLSPARSSLFTRAERNLLLEDGAATFKTDVSGNCFIERTVTTYKTNANGVGDTTFRDLETLDTLAAIRYTTRARITTKYPRHKLADDGTAYGPGQAVVTPSVIKSEIIALFREWEALAWVEDGAQFKEELIVERNASDRNRMDARMGPNFINQFRVFAGQVQFIV